MLNFTPARITGKIGNRRPITMYEDNRPCIKWVENPCAHSKVKHIDVPLKFIRDDIMVDKTIDLQYINTQAQLADQFTKQLSPKVHWHLLENITNLPRSTTTPADQHHAQQQIAWCSSPAATELIKFFS